MRARRATAGPGAAPRRERAVNATSPPRDGPAAMAARAAWRHQFGRWIEGPRALLSGPQAPQSAGLLRAAM